MKVRILALLSLVLIACKTDDEPVIADSLLEGEWKLSQVICYCGFEPNTDFSLTTVVFDPDRNLVTVNHEGEYTFFREAGEHFYGGQGDEIGFADDTVFRFEVQGSILTLTLVDNPKIADDEVTYVFKR